MDCRDFLQLGCTDFSAAFGWRWAKSDFVREQVHGLEKRSNSKELQLETGLAPESDIGLSATLDTFPAVRPAITFVDCLRSHSEKSEVGCVVLLTHFRETATGRQDDFTGGSGYLLAEAATF